MNSFHWRVKVVKIAGVPLVKHFTLHLHRVRFCDKTSPLDTFLNLFTVFGASAPPYSPCVCYYRKGNVLDLLELLPENTQCAVEWKGHVLTTPI